MPKLTTGISQATYPVIYETIDVIRHDVGGRRQTVYRVEWAPDALSRIELALSSLTESERETLAIGSDDDRDSLLVARNPDLKLADQMFNELFETL